MKTLGIILVVFALLWASYALFFSKKAGAAAPAAGGTNVYDLAVTFLKRFNISPRKDA